jgi:hypothetical protein
MNKTCVVFLLHLLDDVLNATRESLQVPTQMRCCLIHIQNNCSYPTPKCAYFFELCSYGLVSFYFSKSGHIAES